MTKQFFNRWNIFKESTPTQQEKFNIKKYKKEAKINGAIGASETPVIDSFIAENEKNLNVELAPLQKELIQMQSKKQQATNGITSLETKESFHTEVYAQTFIEKNADALLGFRNQALIFENAIKEKNYQLAELELKIEGHKKPSKFKVRALIFIVGASYFGFEVNTLYQYFESIFYSEPYKGAIAASAVSLMGLLSGHFSGTALYKKKYLSASFWGIIGVLINAVSIFIRYSIELEATPELISISTLILISYFICTLISKYLSNDNDLLDLFGEYEAIKREITADKEELIKINSKIETLEKGAIPYAESQYKKEWIHLTNSIQECDLKEVEIKNSIQEVTTKYQDREKQAKAEIKKAYEEGTRKNRASFKFAMIALLVGSSFLFTACEQKEPENINLGFLIDVSSSQANDSIDSIQLFNFIWKELEIREEKEFEQNGFTILFANIGSSMTPQVVSVRLAPQKGNFFLSNRLVRNDEVQNFKKELHKAITQIAQTPRIQKSTNVWSSIQTMTDQFQNDAKISLYVVSDYISSNPLISLEKYRKKPRKILEDYPILNSKLTEDRSLSNNSLNNFEITLIRRVQNERDEQLSYYSELFFERLIQERLRVHPKTRAQF